MDSDHHIFIGHTGDHSPPATLSLEDRRDHALILDSDRERLALMENLIVQDIEAARGVIVFDVSGALINRIVGLVPPWRASDAVLFRAGDRKAHICFNPVETIKRDDRPKVAGDIVKIFTSIWGTDGVGARSQSYLRNSLKTLLDAPDGTMLGLPLLLANDSYRDYLIAQTRDQAARTFWRQFLSKPERFREEAIAPLENKLDAILGHFNIRNILAAKTSSFDFDFMRRNQRVVLVDLGGQQMGEESASLLASLLIGRLALNGNQDNGEAPSVSANVFIPEANLLPPKLLYELVRAKENGINLTLGTPRLAGLHELVHEVGTLVAHKSSLQDAEALASMFSSLRVSETDIVDQPAGHFYLKQAYTEPVQCSPLETLGQYHGRGEAIFRNSRNRYYVNRSRIERWLNRFYMKWEA